MNPITNLLLTLLGPGLRADYGLVVLFWLESYSGGEVLGLPNYNRAQSHGQMTGPELSNRLQLITGPIEDLAPLSGNHFTPGSLQVSGPLASYNGLIC